MKNITFEIKMSSYDKKLQNTAINKETHEIILHTAETKRLSIIDLANDHRMETKVKMFVLAFPKNELAKKDLENLSKNLDAILNCLMVYESIVKFGVATLISGEDITDLELCKIRFSGTRLVHGESVDFNMSASTDCESFRISFFRNTIEKDSDKVEFFGNWRYFREFQTLVLAVRKMCKFF